MKNLNKNSLGRLRIFAFLEGISLLILVFIAVPLKYMMDEPAYVKTIGPIHGALFLLYVFSALHTGVEQNWKRIITIKVILACFIPFGTFYLDKHIFSKIGRDQIQ